MGSPKWKQYFEQVYGDVPQDGYPICVSGFRVVHQDVLQAVGISRASKTCEQHNVFHSRTNVLESYTWVEISHFASKGERHSAWTYYMPGSGIWYNLGVTKVYRNHEDSWEEVLNKSRDQSGWLFRCTNVPYSTRNEKVDKKSDRGDSREQF